ncbi:MAG: ABC transporter ATP-binding protein [Spirochaetaceae bacterium]|jgi:putative ABC transport system ATP-binding protein|nr:ABC transporter ATP-binding protein [Spirochaetaceae bacterium]GMO18831.1 MAG: ABC transporter ATP-binding protein [Termitinemataceae bacterium]
MSEVVILQNVSKIYGMKHEAVHALRDVSFSIEHGEYVSIMGPSGSGKSTCMNIIGALDRPSSGLVRINGSDTAAMEEHELAMLRGRAIGFVFQQYHLLTSMTVLENVMLPLRYMGFDKQARRKRALEVLEQVSMSDRVRHYPAELSGGQKQRAAIARAMAASPEIVLADEPTGALDSETGALVLKMFEQVNRSGTTVILVTHDVAVAREARRRIKIYDGVIVEDTCV